MVKDQYDEQAERLLPCLKSRTGQNDCYTPVAGETFHHEYCPYGHRPAVAAALREEHDYWLQDLNIAESLNEDYCKKIADLRRGYTANGVEAWPCPGCKYEAGKFISHCGLHKQIADLRAENDRLKRDLSQIADRQKAR